MSKIVVFYEKDEEIRGTVVNGHAFVFVSHVISHLNYDEICEFIDQGVKNNGYHWNAVKDDYEFWSAGKSSVNHAFKSMDEINKFSCDAKFKVDLEKSLVPFR